MNRFKESVKGILNTRYISLFVIFTLLVLLIPVFYAGNGNNLVPFIKTDKSSYCEGDTVNISYYSPSNGSLIVSSHEENWSVDINGEGTYGFQPPYIGNYSVSLICENITESTKFSVVRCLDDIKIDTKEYYCEGEGKIPIYSPYEEGEIEINGTVYSVYFLDGVYYLDVPEEPGFYSITVKSGNLTKSANFTVIKCNVLEIYTDKEKYLENESISVGVYAFVNGENYTGFGNLTVKDGEERSLPLDFINGYAGPYSMLPLSPDNYTLIVNVENLQVNKTIEVLKILEENKTNENVTSIEPEKGVVINIIANDTYCEDEVQKICIESSEKGNVTFSVDGNEKSILVNETYCEFLSLSEGEHKIEAIFGNVIKSKTIEVINCSEARTVENKTVENITENVTQNLTNVTNTTNMSSNICTGFDVNISKTVFDNSLNNIMIGAVSVNCTEHTGEINISIKGNGNEYYSVIDVTDGLFEFMLPVLEDGNYEVEFSINNMKKVFNISIVSKGILNTFVNTEYGPLNLSIKRGSIDVFDYKNDELFIRIVNISKGEKVPVKLTLPFEIPEGYHFYLWKTVGNKTVAVDYKIENDRRTIDFVLQDGKLDEDGLENGIIVDPLILPKPPKFTVNITKMGKKAVVEVRESSKKMNLELQTTKGELNDVKIVDPDTYPQKPRMTKFKFKMFKINITNITPGSSVDFIIKVPEKLSSAATFWKYSPEKNIWYQYPFVRLDDYTIKITLTDGGEGDEDGIANGIIIDDAGISDSWWNISWLYRKTMNITYEGEGNLTNYPVRIIIDTQTPITEGKMNSDCSDIRFTWWNETNVSEEKISYYIKSGCGTTNTEIWVKVPLITNITYGNTTIAMYYGNTTPVVSESNYTEVFGGQEEIVASYDPTLGAPICSESTGKCLATSSLLMCNDNQAAPGPEPNQPNTIDSCTDSSTSGTCHSDESIENITVEVVDGAAFMGGKIVRVNVTGYCWGTSDYVAVFYTNDTINPQWVRISPTGLTCPASGVYNTWSFEFVLNNTNGLQAVRGVMKYNSDVNTACDGASSSYTDQDDVAFKVIQSATPEPVVNVGGEEYVSKIKINLTEPLDNTVFTRYQSFIMNATIECTENCSDTYIYSQFIKSSYFATTIEENTTEEFANFSESQNISAVNNTLRLSSEIGLGSWIFEDWNYRKEINISNSDVNGYENYPYKINITYETNMQPDFSDLRFTWVNNTTLVETKIPYWIEQKIDSSWAVLWIKIPYLYPSGTTQIMMYYGNTTPVVSESNYTEVFGGQEEIVASYDSTLGAPICSESTGKCLATSSLLMCNDNQASPGPEPNQPNTIDSCTDSSTSGTCHSDESIENITVEVVDGAAFMGGKLVRVNVTGYCWGTSDYVAVFYTNDTINPQWVRISPTGLTCPASGVYNTWSFEFVLNNTNGLQAVRGVMKYNSDVNTACDGASSSYTDQDDVAFKVIQSATPEPVVNVGGEESKSYKLNGYYISKVFDLGTSNVQYGKITWFSIQPTDTDVKVYTRSSSDGVIWSPWYLEVNDSTIDAAPKRYLQYKVEMSSSDSSVTPKLTKIILEYSITKPAFINMESSGTDFTTSDSNPQIYLDFDKTKSPWVTIWNVIPQEKGMYILRVWGNSSNTEIEPAQSQWINVTVYEQTYLTDMSIEPSVQAKGNDVTISVRLLDSLSNPIPNAFINFTDETSGIIIGNDTTDSNGYATITYHIPEDTTIGYHTIKAEYPQNDTLFYFGSQAIQQFKVSSTPKIWEVNTIPKHLGTKEKELIQANITDEVGVDTVLLYLTYPNSTQIVKVMTYNSTSGYYEYLTEDLWDAGTYEFYIWVNNTDGIYNESEIYNFYVNIIGRIDTSTEKDKYKNFELVHLNNIDKDWPYPDYTYRDIYYIYSDKTMKEVPVNLFVNTSELINNGEMNPNCSDIKFAQEIQIEELPIEISNPYGVTKYDFTFPITITDKEALSKMSSDGRDIRIYSYQTDTPYASQSDIPFWVESITESQAKIWVKLSTLPTSGTTIYIYYGNFSADPESNYTNVFTDIVGEAGIVYGNDVWVDFRYLNSTTDERFVFSSLDSYYEADEAFTRITEVNNTGFRVIIQESVGLDGVHTSEIIGWLALRKGEWIIEGKEWQISNLSVSGSYTHVTYLDSYENRPIIFSQMQTYRDTTPSKSRMDNPDRFGFDVKVEPGSTDDTYTTYENIAWFAAEPGIYNPGVLIEIGEKYHNQPSDVSTTSGWTSYSLTAGFTSTPAVIGKLETEYGGDNTHERIRNVGTTGFQYAMEEEYGHDGPHTYEWNSYIAIEPNKPIYGTKKYSTWPSITEKVLDKRVIQSINTELPHWIESGCNSNTSIWVKISSLGTGKNKIYMYYGNPNDTVVEDTETDEINVFTYSDKYGAYVILGIGGSNLDVSSYSDNNEISIGSATTTLNKNQVYTFSYSDVISGSLLYSKGPVSSGTQSSGDGAPATPLVFKGREFVFPVSRYSPLYIDVFAVENAKVQIWDSGSGPGWHLNDSFTIGKGVYTSKTLTGAPNTDGNSEFAYLINSTGDIVVFVRQNSDDYLPLVPASKELYLEPTDWVEIAAIYDNTNINLYFSDGTSTTITLNAGETYSSSGYGGDGTAPALRLVADKPIFAYQLADTDGTEASPSLSISLMDKVFVFPNNGEYFVAVTPAGSVTNCTLYRADGTVRAGPWISTAPGSEYPGKIGYGTGQDGTVYIYAGDMLVCNNSVRVHYEQDLNDAETLIYGPKAHQKLTNITIEKSYQEDKWVNLENNGNTTIRGYLYAIVQKWDGSSWINIPPAVINDIATNNLREIEPGDAINLTYLWDSHGAWNTSDRESGKYRIYFALTDENGNELYDFENRYLKDYAYFEIIPANVTLVNLTHPNKEDYLLEEYETGDIINWINMTVKAFNNSAINTVVHLTFTDSDGNYVGFGPENEEYYCGIIYENEYCYPVFDNSSYGYLIPEDQTFVDKNVTMKVNITLDNGADYINITNNITVHNIPATFSSTTPDRLYQNGNPVYYNFTMKNLWSKNITNVKIGINCPQLTGLSCVCLGTTSSICDIGNMTPGETKTVSFEITATEDTPTGDYIINATVNYTNPAGVNHTWKEQKPQILEIRTQGIMEINVTSYPQNVTRGETADFKAYANNTGTETANEAWLAYTSYPSGWSITSGTENVTATNVAPGEHFWNNVTFTLSLSSELGPQEVRLDSGSDIGQHDFKVVYVNVYGNTSIQIWVNDSEVSKGEGVRIFAKLLLDNGTAVSGETVKFYDETENTYLGSATTDSTGVAYVDYYLDDSVSTGSHIINVTYDGSSTKYLNPSDNETTIDIGLKPQINEISYYPSDIVGYGENITIRANVTDDNGIDFVEIKIESPSGSVIIENMTHTTGDIYEYNYSDTWINGTYSVTVTAHDTYGSINTSTSSFKVEVSGFIILKTTKRNYNPAETVYLDSAPLYSFKFKRKIIIENATTYDITEYQLEVIVDTETPITEGKMKPDCSDMRFTWFNKTDNTEVQIPYYLDYGCGSNETAIWIKVPVIYGNDNTTIYMYYGNSKAESESNETAVFSFTNNETTFYVVSYTDSQSSLNVIAFNDSTHVNFNGNSVVLNSGNTYTFGAGNDMALGVSHDKPIFGAFSSDATDALHPVSWAGKRFVYVSPRGTNEWYIYAPFGDAQVSIYDSTTLKTTLNIPNGTAYRAQVDITDGNAVIIESNVSILVEHADPTNAYDSQILYPATTKLYGVPSTHITVAALEDGTHVDVYCSDGSTYSIDLNRGDAWDQPYLPSEGTAPACVVIANKPVGASQYADSDGTEMTSFLPLKELDRFYYFSQGVQYIAIAAPYTTECTLYNPDGTIYGIDSATPNGQAPGKIYFGSTSDGTNIQAGSWMICTQPVFAYYEYSGVSGGDETNLYGPKGNRKYVGFDINYTIEDEDSSGSAVIELARKFRGYVIIEIQKNESGVWVHKVTLLNDTDTGTEREFEGIYDLSTIASSWNPEGETGEYRVVGYVTTPDGSILNSTDGIFWYAHYFNVTEVPVKLNISDIRVYEAPNNEHGGGTLVSSGTNRTFNLETGKTYRFEIDVSVLSDSQIWNISEADVLFDNLNSSWYIDTTNNIWYLNETDSVERSGGTFDGTVRWDTVGNDGTGSPGTTVTFYFIVNLSDAIPEERGVMFNINSSQYIFRDFDTIKVYQPDTQPPKLWNEIYGINTTELLRGEPFKVYGRWDEEISEAYFEYNSTTSLLVNDSIALPVPNPENWTNISKETTSLWLLGRHVAKIYASDVAGNWNGTLPYIEFYIYGLAYVDSMSVNDTSPYLNDYISATCLVKDDTNGEAIEGYNVTFYYDDSYIGYALTNSSGYATITYQVTTPGDHIIKCNITNQSWYKVDERNSSETNIYVNELEPPKWWDVTGPTKVHKGDTVTLSTRWTDNFALDTAVLSTNESGWVNVSSISLSGTEAWANFTYQIPLDISTGYLAWKQYGNDTSNNQNVTSEQIIEVWGWSEINESFVEPGSIQTGNWTIMNCHVRDSNDTQPIEGYNVSFYLDNTYLGWNLTNSTGWAIYNFTPSGSGVFTVKCDISDYVDKKYNASGNNEGSDTLTVTTSEDTIPPKIVDGNYGLNATTVYRYDSVLVYGQWNEEIDKAWVEYNATNTFTTDYFDDSGTPENWTNYTITTDDSWVPGIHVVKLYANDTSGNINDTLDYLSFEMWGRSAVEWVAPQSPVYRTNVTIICKVKDYDTNDGIADYTVAFYNSTDYLGSNVTNSTGYAQFTVDLSSYQPGTETFYCTITDDNGKYYDAVVTSVSYDLEIRGKLNVTIVSPSDESILERGLSYDLESVTVDEFGNSVTPTAVWYDGTTQIGTGENITWTVPTDHALGSDTLKVNVTKDYYDSDEDTVNVYIYGHSEPVWISPNGGSYPEGITIDLTCFVNDTDLNSGINGYSVGFYYNGTLIATTTTNSSGYATTSWDTTGLGGIYNVSCVISDSNSLYYKAVSTEDHTFIEIYVDTVPPTVNIILPENVTYNTNDLTLNYTASDDHSLDSCWYSLDGGTNTSLPGCENTTLSGLADGTHVVRVYANDSAGNEGYDEVYFTVDTQAPIITIVSPENETYGDSSIWANVTTNEDATCWYSLDGGANNSMTSLNSTYWYDFVSGLGDGTHEIVYYCNDTGGNENSTSVVFTIDTIAPSLLLYQPEDNQTLDTNNVEFVCEASDNIQLVNVSLYTNETGSLTIVDTNSSGINGNYTFIRTLSDNVYEWTCEVCDAVRCVQETPRIFYVDTAAPVVSIVSPENITYNVNTIDLNYTVDDLTLQSCWYSLDGGVNTSLPGCENTTLSGLSDGTHVVRVYANDSLGREGYDEVYFTVDVTPPSVYITSPTNNTDYGINVIPLNYSASDNIELVWCAYSLDNGSNVTLPSCENTTLTGLENDIHNVTVYARDEAGNENYSYVNFSVSSVAPVVTIYSPEDGKYYPIDTVDLNYTAEDSDLDSCWYSLDGGTNTSLPGCENTTLSGLSDGTHVVRVYANDSAGHESYDESTFYVDTVNPVVNIVDPKNETYNTSSIELNYTVTDDNTDSCWYSLDGGTNTSLPGCENTTLSGLADGTHVVRVYANDSAGNEGYDEVYFTVDTQAPIITIVSPENETYLTDTVDVNYTVEDDNLDSCWYKLDNGEYVYLTSCENFTLSGLVDGTHELTIYANDTAKNINSSSVVFSIDTQGPVITFVPPTPSDNQALDYNWTYINITTNEDASIAYLEWDYNNGTKINYTMNSLTVRSFWFNVTELEDGTYYYKVYANDTYDHWGVSETRTVRISVGAPVIDIISPQPITYNETNYIELNVTANKEIDTWWFSINGKENETFTPNTSIAAKEGNNVLYVYGNDTTGKVGWSQVNFYVNTTKWEDYFDTKSGIGDYENVSANGKLSIDLCWYVDACYLYRKEFDISSSTSETDYQVNITTDTQSLISAGKMNDTCKDIRFTFVNSTGEYEIPYYIESGCGTTNTKIWIKVPQIAAGTTKVYMYYGNNEVESKSNKAEVFETYSDSQTCSGSTAGGTCPMTFTAPSGYEFYDGSIDLEAAGDMGYGGAYADDTTCDTGETYERFNVTVEGNCYGVYSPGIDDCTLTHISTWPRNSTDMMGKTSFTVTPQVNSKVNADPNGCGFYYSFRANFTGYLKKAGYVDSITEGTEEGKVVNGYAKTILIQPEKVTKWDKLYVDYDEKGESINVEVYDSENNMLKNCTGLNVCDLSDIINNSLYVKMSLFTDTPWNSPEIYHINVTWNRTTPITVEAYNESNTLDDNTYLEMYRNGNLVASGYKQIYPEIEKNENYTLVTSTNDGLNVEIIDINITDPSRKLTEQIVRHYTGYLPSNISNVTMLFAFNQSDLSIDHARLVIPKNGLSISYVMHCVDWDFSTANCNNWEMLDPATVEGYGENSTHIWFNVTEFEAYGGGQLAYDYQVNNVWTNVTEPVEGEPVEIHANVSNNGGSGGDVLTRLYIYLWNATESSWKLVDTEDSTIYVGGDSWNITNFTWTAEIGWYNFTVVVDPDNTISESDETNNQNWTDVNVSAWAVYYGYVNGWMMLADSLGNNFTAWVPQTKEGNIYYADYDSDYEFDNLMPLNGTNDLEELDEALNMSYLEDSVKKLFDKDNNGIPDNTACFEIGLRTVCDVPVINSTDSNNGNFITGILWDAGDGGTEYDGTQDVVFITKINTNKAGAYGTYDYEARIPARLRELKGTTDEIDTYVEIK